MSDEIITIRHPIDIVMAVEKYKYEKQEHFVTLALDGNHQLISENLVTKGLTNKVIIRPLEALYPAFRDLASTVVFAHNHPSGSNFPSIEDNEITERLKCSCQIMGIYLLDHVILTKDNYFSYRINGMLGNGHEYDNNLNFRAETLLNEGCIITYNKFKNNYIEILKEDGKIPALIAANKAIGLLNENEKNYLNTAFINKNINDKESLKNHLEGIKTKSLRKSEKRNIEEGIGIAI